MKDNKKTFFYQTVKWATWFWALFGMATIIYAYTLLWDFKQHAETYNDFNAVQLSWEKPYISELESWHVVVDYCMDEACGRMQGADIYHSKDICDVNRQEIVADTIDVGGVWAYRCVEKQDI
tara:strand:+ start:1154 stop:1519 length:366 start_codon:yes stop_codon:yes gene_type:complete